MPEVQPLRPGDPHTLGGFRLDGRLGVGSQGVVFLAGAAAGEPVAVKLLYAAPASWSDAALKVDSVCTARVLAADLSGDLPYLVSEYVGGPSLREHVEENGPLAGNALQRLAVHVATALNAIHQIGLAHGDLKPANVLLATEGARVTDFALPAPGTPAHQAPERLSGQPPAPASDIWSWATTVIYAATGRSPFGDDSGSRTTTRVQRADPDFGRLSGPLRRLTADCLTKTPAQRPSAHDLLLRLLGHENPNTPEDPRPSAYPDPNTPAPGSSYAAAPTPAPDTPGTVFSALTADLGTVGPPRRTPLSSPNLPAKPPADPPGQAQAASTPPQPGAPAEAGRYAGTPGPGGTAQAGTYPGAPAAAEAGPYSGTPGAPSGAEAVPYPGTSGPGGTTQTGAYSGGPATAEAGPYSGTSGAPSGAEGVPYPGTSDPGGTAQAGAYPGAAGQAGVSGGATQGQPGAPESGAYGQGGAGQAGAGIGVPYPGESGAADSGLYPGYPGAAGAGVESGQAAYSGVQAGRGSRAEVAEGGSRGRRRQREDAEDEGALDSGIQVRLGPLGSGGHARDFVRREAAEPRERGRGRLLVGVGVLAVAAVVAGVLLWPKASQQAPPVQTNTGTGATQRDTPKTGTPQTVSTATGDTYTVAAAGGGPDDAPRSPAPSGSAYASGDYVLTNALGRPVLLDLNNLPADLFVRRSLVPPNQLPVCQQQAGVPADFCTLSDTSRIIGYLNHSQPPTQKDGDLYMPPHASYLIRVSTDLALTDQLRQQDLSLYIWRAIYVPDQQARPLPFPN